MTSLFVEIVVSGIHTILWIGLIFLALLGYQNVDLERLLNINLALPVLAIAYILGIVIDRLADSAFITIDYKLREGYINRFKDQDFPSFLAMRFHILKNSREIYEQLEYTRSRLRIARTSILNFTLTTLAILLFLWFQFSSSLSVSSLIGISLATIIFGGGLTYLSYQSWMGLTKNYTISTYIAYQVVREKNEKGDKNPLTPSG